MNTRRPIILATVLIFLAIALILGLYLVQQTQNIGKKAQTADLSCPEAGGIIIDVSSDSIICPPGFVQDPRIIIDNQIIDQGSESSDLVINDDIEPGNEIIPTSTQTQQICCIPIPTTPGPTNIIDPSPTPSRAPTGDPTPTIQVTYSPTPPIPTPTPPIGESPTPTPINILFDSARIPQLHVDIESDCPLCN